MVLIYGVDMPLNELILTFVIMTFLIFVEAIIIIILLLYQYRSTAAILKKIEKR